MTMMIGSFSRIMPQIPSIVKVMVEIFIHEPIKVSYNNIS